ncbi:MAG: ABC transporter permease [Rhodobacteraceae bacterium]|nr:ABC transporter permease [Paracoccaceae bacterium]
MSLAHLLRRLVALAVILLCVSALVFAITQILPGNAAVMILVQNATADELRALEVQLGLDRPAWVQYGRWIGGVLAGDAGISMTSSRPVLDVVLPALGRSLILAGITLAVMATGAVLLGVAAAVRRGRLADFVISALVYPGVCVPEFVVGTLLVVLLARPELGWFPAGGYAPLSQGLLGFARSIALPALTLTIILTSRISRQVRSEMIDVLKSDYVRTATLKGLPRRAVLFRHALPNAMLPTLTILALDIGYLIGGTVVVEEVFAYPGLGRLLIFSMQSRDLPVIQAGVLAMAVVYVTANLVADLLHSAVDPRVRADG